ncbi:MAG: lysostaphin resistance A-like protein, partial [Pirellulales bacterium]
MSTEPPPHENEPLPNATSVSRGHPWIAWCVIVGVATLVIWRHGQPDRREKRFIENRLLSVISDWQARYLVGAAKLFPDKESQQFADAAAVDSGPMDQRLRGVVVVGEISGPKAAAEKLDAVQRAKKDEAATEQDRETIDALVRLYDDLKKEKPTLPSLKPDDRQRITDQLGWSGQLALHPAGGGDAAGRDALLEEARRTITSSLLVFAALGALTLAGLAALATVLVLLAIRPQARALRPQTSHGGIYAETFAVWIALYVALSYAAAFLPVGQNRLPLTIAVMLASLTALAWPRLRGVPWSTVRDDVGLRFGRRPVVELLLGPVCYISALPLVVVGVLIIAALMALERKLTGNAGGEFSQQIPSHPIVGWLLEASWWEKLQIVILASVMAPLVEETMFRGVLYRHLRDATARFGYAASVLASSLAVSFVFAAIHPQGWIGVPVLMGLALAFNLAREWRGTLLP